MKDLVKVPAEDIDKVWDACAPLLQKALSYSEGYYDIDDLYWKVKTSQQEIWVLFGEEIDLVGTTKIVHHPNKSVLEIPFVASRENSGVDDFRAFLDQVEDWAKGEGAEATVFCARIGWKKLFPEFELKHTLMMKDYEV